MLPHISAAEQWSNCEGRSMKPTRKSEPPVTLCPSASQVWRVQRLAAAVCLSCLMMGTSVAAYHPFYDTCAGRCTCNNDRPNRQAKSGFGMACRVFVNQMLSGVQQRNLERAWGRPVVDRMGLIIDIFAQRARTKEARLQVGTHAYLHALSLKKCSLRSSSLVLKASSSINSWLFCNLWLREPHGILLMPC